MSIAARRSRMALAAAAAGALLIVAVASEARVTTITIMNTTLAFNGTDVWCRRDLRADQRLGCR